MNRVENRSSLSEASRRLRQEALTLTASLTEAGAEAVALYGSAARGDATEASDLDMFVVWPGKRPRISQLDLAGVDVEPELSFAGWPQLAAPKRQWGYFRMVADSALYLHDPDGDLQRHLESLPDPDPNEIVDEADFFRKSIPTEAHLDRYNGIYFFLYGHCYRWPKAAVMQANLLQGTPRQRRDEALTEFAHRHSDLKEDVGWLRYIEPFYLLNMQKGEEDALPFPSKGTDEKARRSILAGQRVVARACDEIEDVADRLGSDKGI